ncbi:hypothetical protein D9R12_04175 [Pseudoxanthomonas spadix]|nr:hypothetical protein D9R12_04175 [Pseudoxanthomonas spadix]
MLLAVITDRRAAGRASRSVTGTIATASPAPGRCLQRRAKARATPPQPSPAAQGRGQAVAVEPAPGEPVAILEALKRAGALRAELEIIQGWAWRRLPGFGKASACSRSDRFSPPPFCAAKGRAGEGSLLCLQRRAKARATPPQPSPAAQGRGRSSGRGAGAW